MFGPASSDCESGGPTSSMGDAGPAKPAGLDGSGAKLEAAAKPAGLDGSGAKLKAAAAQRLLQRAQPLRENLHLLQPTPSGPTGCLPRRRRLLPDGLSTMSSTQTAFGVFGAKSCHSVHSVTQTGSYTLAPLLAKSMLGKSAWLTSPFSHILTMSCSQSLARSRDHGFAATRSAVCRNSFRALSLNGRSLRQERGCVSSSSKNLPAAWNCGVFSNNYCQFTVLSAIC